MSLFSPAALLWFIPAAGLIILAHCLNTPRELVRIPSLFLWEKIPSTPQARLRLRPPRLSPLLFLQLISALLFCVAAAKPQLITHQAIPDDVIVIDNSASSAAITATGTALDEIKERALAMFVAAERHGDHVSLVTTSPPTLILSNSASGVQISGGVASIKSYYLLPDLAEHSKLRRASHTTTRARESA